MPREEGTEHVQVLVTNLTVEMSGERVRDAVAWCPQVPNDVFGCSGRQGCFRRGLAKPSMVADMLKATEVHGWIIAALLGRDAGREAHVVECGGQVEERSFGSEGE